MRTLEQAIEHAEEVAKDYEEMIGDYALDSEKLAKCAENQRQIAELLRELVERRKQPEIIHCNECRHRFTHNCVANTWVSVFGYTVDDNFYCGFAERRTDD